MLCAWSPELRAPELLHRREDVRDDKRAALRKDRAEGVQPRAGRGICCIEMNEIVRAASRDPLKNLGREIAMRVDEEEAASVMCIGDAEFLEERRLAASGLADDERVQEPGIERR